VLDIRFADSDGVNVEVLVSGMVRDLVAGSGLEFTDRGTHQLRGISEEWRVFAAE
jgi:class 3 adenylate cyclase